MDLWDNVENDINKLGVKVKDLVAKSENNSFITFQPKGDDNGVVIKNF